jgi:hypothetical protein
MKPRPRAGSLMGFLAIVALTSPATAQSPGPAGSLSSPVASPAATPAATPADCASASALLPPVIDDLSVVTTTTPGVLAIDPEELLDPLLVSLGRSRTDVCVVVFRYGSGAGALVGQLLHISGADVPDLAGRFTDALRDRLVAYEGEAVASVIAIDGQPVWSLDVTASGQHSQVLTYQLGDTLLVMSEPSAMGRLLASVTLSVPPSPSVSPSG